MRAKEFITEALSTAAIDATANQLGSKLMPRLKKDVGYKKFTDPKQFIEWVASEIDPSPNSRYARWVVSLYANNGVRLIEDLHKLTDPLTRYAKLVQSGKMPAENRDINKFKNLASFLDLMDQYQETKTSREVRSNEEQELFDTKQVQLYKDTGDIKIVIPKTMKAAKYYGRGTRWCTAGDKDNRFDAYNREGPLYVIIFRNSGRKWQFHFETSQFMDEHDEPLDSELVKPISHLFTEDMWNKVVRQYGPNIRYIENPTEQMKLIAVKEDGTAIRFIKNPSIEVQLVAVKQNGNAIRYIKNPTEQVQLVAVKQNGTAIKYIENPSEQVQLAAVNNNGLAIRYIKNPTEQVQLVAVKKYGSVIEYIKNPSEQVQLAAVKQYGFAIYCIENPSLEVQLTAVNQNGTAIKYIENPSEQVQLAAVNNNGLAITYIKNPTEQMKIAAVKKNGSVIEYIKNPSEQVQLAVVKEHGVMITYIKNPSEEVQLAAVKQDPDAIRYIKNPTERVKRAAGIR